VRDQVSCPYKTPGKVIVLDIFNLDIFGKQTGRQKMLQMFPEFSLFLISV
jgi:hypothetical protein